MRCLPMLSADRVVAWLSHRTDLFETGIQGVTQKKVAAKGSPLGPFHQLVDQDGILVTFLLSKSNFIGNPPEKGGDESQPLCQGGCP